MCAATALPSDETRYFFSTSTITRRTCLPLDTRVSSRRPQRHSGVGGPAPKAATRVAASTPPPSI